MVARTGFSATTSRKSRQARKGAAVAAMSGAGGELVRAASSGLLIGKNRLRRFFRIEASLPAAKSVVFAA
jgi:hypothetical protein